MNAWEKTRLAEEDDAGDFVFKDLHQLFEGIARAQHKKLADKVMPLLEALTEEPVNSAVSGFWCEFCVWAWDEGGNNTHSEACPVIAARALVAAWKEERDAG